MYVKSENWEEMIAEMRSIIEEKRNTTSSEFLKWMEDVNRAIGNDTMPEELIEEIKSTGAEIKPTMILHSPPNMNWVIEQ